MNLKNRPPVFVPDQYQTEIEKFSKAFLMDMVWDFARRGMVDDDENTMGRIRETAEIVQIYRDRQKSRMQVDHIDGDPRNNDPANLRLVTLPTRSR